ncbi:MAG: UDP binding domain-containing protein, partial [Eubacterium sp.]
IKQAKIAILGFTFKENCPDIRNTKVIDIINELREYGIEPLICDPEADKEEAKEEYDVAFTEYQDLKEIDAVIIAVAHQSFAEKTLEQYSSLYRNQENKILMDLKGLMNRQACEAEHYTYWRL